MKITTANAALIELTFKNYFLGATIKTNKSAAGEIDSVTANIQGPIAGTELSEILETVKVTQRTFSIYRSGTGLTIKFV